RAAPPAGAPSPAADRAAPAGGSAAAPGRRGVGHASGPAGTPGGSGRGAGGPGTGDRRAPREPVGDTAADQAREDGMGGVAPFLSRARYGRHSIAHVAPNLPRDVPGGPRADE